MRGRGRLRLSLRRWLAVRNMGSLVDLSGRGLRHRLFWLAIVVWRDIAGCVVVIRVAATLARIPAPSLRRTANPLDAFRCPPCRTQCAFQIPLSAPGARKLLVTLGLCLRTITAGDGRAAGGLWYYALRREALFVVLVAAVYGVVSLQKISEESVSTLFRTVDATG